MEAPNAAGRRQSDAEPITRPVRVFTVTGEHLAALADPMNAFTDDLRLVRQIAADVAQLAEGTYVQDAGYGGRWRKAYVSGYP